MDLQKDEDFEKAWQENHHIWESTKNLAKAMFYAGQAAKAQAVPEGEGFVLVSQKELMELAIAINAVDLATHTEEKPNEVREMWQQVALKLGALCSTGAN